jgi:hypothetical protein
MAVNTLAGTGAGGGGERQPPRGCPDQAWPRPLLFSASFFTLPESVLLQNVASPVTERNCY